MRRILPPLLVLVLLGSGLGGCANGQLALGTPVTLTNSEAVIVADTDLAVQTGYTAASKLYLAAAPTMDPALKAKLKALFHTALMCNADKSVCSGYLVVAHTAALAGNSATLTQQIALVTQTVAQINLLLKPAS